MSDNTLTGIPGLPGNAKIADAVPFHLRDGLRRYVEHGIPPGDFLKALISNRLWETLTRADDTLGRDEITAIFRWLYQCAPPECFGTFDKMQAWVDAGGMQRVAA
jgi:hypothetical protein